MPTTKQSIRTFRGKNRGLGYQEQVAKLATSFEQWAHPNAHLIVAMRKLHLRDGVSPIEVMTCWLAKRQPKGMLRLLLPAVNERYGRIFNQMVDMADAVADHPARAKLRNYLWAGANVLVVEMIDPSWRGPRIVDLDWPANLEADSAFVMNSDLRTLIHDAQTQNSYRIIFGRD